jgi:hypothetical protein
MAPGVLEVHLGSRVTQQRRVYSIADAAAETVVRAAPGAQAEMLGWVETAVTVALP